MLVTFCDGVFIAHAETDGEKKFALAAGFVDDGFHISVQSAQVASRLRKFCDEKANRQINRIFIKNQPWTGRIPHPPHLTPYPFQIEAAKFALSRNRSYLALDPGLGKTIVATLIWNALEHPPLVFIVPPFLALNTSFETTKWCVERKKGRNASPLVVPDSLIVDPLGSRLELYNRIEKMAKDPRAILIVDEAQRFKTIDSQRTRALFNIAKWFNRIVFLSGTPMPNRPLELFPILSRFAPETIGFRNEHEFGMRYCGGRWDGFGYDFSGASNVEELAKSVRDKFMLRIRKGEVLTELPDKIRELVILSEDAPPVVGKCEREILRAHNQTDVMQGKLGADHTSTYRRLLGEAKAPLAIKYLEEILDNTQENLLVFGTHINVIQMLAHGLKRFHPVVITGKIPRDKRNGLVQEFQNDKTKRVFIGNVDACGVGFTLTKATRVVHVEPSWTPGINEQATDRAHRIGQKETVLEQYLVFKNSLDRAVIESNLTKLQSIKLV